MKGFGAGLVVVAAVLAAMFPASRHAADEIHWTLTGPTSVSVHWRGTESVVRYGLTRELQQSADATESTPQPFSSPGPFREARIAGLAEDTRYFYAIGKGPTHTFHTPPLRG